METVDYKELYEFSTTFFSIIFVCYGVLCIYMLLGIYRKRTQIYEDKITNKLADELLNIQDDDFYEHYYFDELDRKIIKEMWGKNKLLV